MSLDANRITPSMRVTAASLAVDRVTAEVMTALEEAGVPARLLKGPALARWLYDDGTPRPYRDTDLLVPPDRETDAEEVLRSLGFEPTPGVGRPDPEGVARNHIWFRGDEMVELHVTLVGIGAAADQVWERLAREPQLVEVALKPLQTVSRTAQLLHLALHAAQHGQAEAKPIEDLRRGIAVAEPGEWKAAAALATELDAGSAMLAGLRLAPGGAELASRLGLEGGADRTARLRATSPPPLAMGVERLAGEPGLLARLRQVVRILAPTPAFLRWWTPLARRGPVGLVAGYLWRYVYLLVHLPGAVLAWRRADRASRG